MTRTKTPRVVDYSGGLPLAQNFALANGCTWAYSYAGYEWCSRLHQRDGLQDGLSARILLLLW
jgi:hypothetical protein